VVPVADLLVRGVDDALVRELKKRAGVHGRSAEAEHRAILAAALLTPPRLNLAELLAGMPDVGFDSDFQRVGDGGDSSEVCDVFD
jgi:plasmid stability protein